MKNDSLKTIADILGSGEFDRFIGMREDVYFEAKSSTPYELKNPSGRYELAKDVSAFANTHGGYLVVGLKTTRLRNQPTDEVSSLDLIQAASINTSTITGIIREHVYPPIESLEVTWSPSKSGSATGLGFVFVPPQPNDKKLFIVTRIIEEDEVQKAIIVGVVRRVGSDNTPWLPRDIYELIRKGNQTNTERLTRMEAKLDALLGRPTIPAPTGEDLTQFARRLRELTGHS